MEDFAQNGGPAVELGKWIGRREAFGTVAGRCSAADAESLRRIKEGKLYEQVNCSWDEFCTEYLHIPRRTVDREIGYLQRFGPAFFTVRQMTHISVREYAAIADHITEDGVRLDTGVVALLPENSGEVADAIGTLVRQSETAAPPPSPEFEALLQRCRSAAQSLRSFGGNVTYDQTAALAAELNGILSAATEFGLLVKQL